MNDTPGFAAAQAQYDAQTPPYDDYFIFEEDGFPVYNDNVECNGKCVIDPMDDCIGDADPDCERHSEPPCDRCGWQAVCPDCVGT